MNKPDKYKITNYPFIAGSDGNYLVEGTQLCTRDGRVMGNAIVVSVLNNTTAKIMTDMGNEVVMTLPELESVFHVPMYLLDVESGVNARRRVSNENLKWISVEDKLPEPDSRILVLPEIDYNEYVRYQMYNGELCLVLHECDYWYDGISETITKSVTHWVYDPRDYPPEVT